MNERSPAAPPAILVVDHDEDRMALVREILERRFAADYAIVTETTGRSALATLEALHGRGAAVAIVLTEQWLPDVAGTDVLARVPSLDRDARRALLIAWSDRTTADWIVKASSLGLIDAYVVQPWRATDEQFCQAITELLVEWDRAHRPQFEAVRIVGDRADAYAHGMRDALQRSGVPHRFYDADSTDGRMLLERVDPVIPRPVAIFLDGRVLGRPTPAQLADALGVNTDPTTEVFDVSIVGSGPAGLAAAVYGASEGLDVVVFENVAIGGQASSSSLIRNYLGFPRGMSGADLTNRAFVQAWSLGARFLIGRGATGVRSESDGHVVLLDDGSEVRSRTIVIATGVSYRRIGIESLDALVGRGVFYGAGVTEAPGMVGEPVYVVGGANSAGQAALHLSRFAASVTLLVRGSSLSEMSEYLVRELDARANVDVRLNTVVVDGRGDPQLTGLLLRDTASGRTEEVTASAVFIMIGAAPRTDWLPGQVQRDERGFIRTGAAVEATADAGSPPAELETSVPGVFAVGDVRAGSMKRVAAAVGEGSTVIRLVHDVLARRHASPPAA